MTRQETVGSGGTAADIEYGYTAPSSTLNDGRIHSRKNKQRNGSNGEDVVYTYDELNRVTQASSSVGWAQSFDYDGFGNLWTANMSGNASATQLDVSFSQTTSTNRISKTGWTYDLNGNTLTMPVPGGSASMTYDIDNRLKTWTGYPGVEEYGYLADNKRVWKKAPSGAETVYFYGVGGQKLLTYTVQSSPFALISPVENVYFGGKLIRANGVAVVHDRLGSVVARVGSSDAPAFSKHDYLPYGEEMDSATGGNVDKFGTYLRDQTTGLDYADQRYFAGTLSGRFLTTDPYAGSAGPVDPGSWNRYGYVGGDPIGYIDRNGEKPCEVGTGNTCTEVVGNTLPVPYAWSPTPPPGIGPSNTLYPDMPPHLQGRIYKNAFMRAKQWQARSSNPDRPDFVNDCQALANFAEDLALDMQAQGESSVEAFVMGFGVFVPGNGMVDLANQLGIQVPSFGNAYAPLNNGSVASGFASGYQDSQNGVPNNNDQAHHFAAFLIFGYQAGNVAGSISSFLYDVSHNNQGDIWLGIAAANLGAGLRFTERSLGSGFQPGGGPLTPLDMAHEIRKLCK
jgi:RHS repeat-associated protein